MNRFVRLWNRPRPVDSIDTIDFGEEKRELMAERGRLPGEVIELSRGHFNNVVRVIARVALSEIGQIRTLTYSNLKRLNVKRDLSKAVTKLPRGSNQVDIGTLGAWMQKITANDKRAIRQLIAIDATCCARGQ